MSRTDAHRPMLVWIADHPELVTEQHDHRTGVCTLPAPGQDARAWHLPGTCHRWLAAHIRLCGCALCTDRPWQRQQRRRERAATRTLLRAATRGADEAELESLEGRARSRSRS